MATPADFSNLSCWVQGNGSWGKNIQRTLLELQVGHLTVGRRPTPLDLNAAFIATPLRTHAMLAKPLIEAGVPVFIEKPFVYTREEGLELVKAWWGSPKAPVLCDFQHLFSDGFEALREELAARRPSHISMVATLGGPGPTRADCHPVWDYGSHLIAMAVELGLSDCLLAGHLLHDRSTNVYTIVGDPACDHHVELSICNTLAVKTRHATIAFDADVVGTYREPVWLVHREYGKNAGALERYSNSESPPLLNSLHAFLTEVNAPKTVLGKSPDTRFGLSLPMQVDAILRRLTDP